MTLLCQGKKETENCSLSKSGVFSPRNHSLLSGAEEVVTSVQLGYRTEKKSLINVKAALTQESPSKISALFPSNYVTLKTTICTDSQNKITTQVRKLTQLRFSICIKKTRVQ